MDRYAELIKELRDEAVSDRSCELHNTGDWHDEIADAIEKLVAENQTAVAKGVTQGCALSISYLLQIDEETVAHEWWGACGMSIARMEAAEVDDFDLALVRKAGFDPATCSDPKEGGAS